MRHSVRRPPLNELGHPEVSAIGHHPDLCVLLPNAGRDPGDFRREGVATQVAISESVTAYARSVMGIRPAPCHSAADSRARPGGNRHSALDRASRHF
jgi:hypothetical protein